MLTIESWAFFICDKGIAEPQPRINEVHGFFMSGNEIVKTM